MHSPKMPELGCKGFWKFMELELGLWDPMPHGYITAPPIRGDQEKLGQCLHVRSHRKSLSD